MPERAWNPWDLGADDTPPYIPAETNETVIQLPQESSFSVPLIGNEWLTIVLLIVSVFAIARAAYLQGYIDGLKH